MGMFRWARSCQGLRAPGLQRNTVWVIYGDHGEAFHQHEGNYGHTFFLYDENIHVPFLIAAPGLMRGQQRIHKVVSLVDTAPTILDLMGIRRPNNYQGRGMLDPAREWRCSLQTTRSGLSGPARRPLEVYIRNRIGQGTAIRSGARSQGVVGPIGSRGGTGLMVWADRAWMVQCAEELHRPLSDTVTYNRGMPRKVILGFGISIDGYIARRNGAMDFLVIDKEGEAVMADFFAKIDTTVMGRKTAAGWVKMRESGEIPETPGMANYVVSRRWKPGKREGFEVVSGSLTAFVKKLKRRPGKDIYLGGGGELARSFLQEDLVDELFIGVGPVLLGDGIPGFPGKFPQRDFKLTECKSYSNGSVGLRYERVRAKVSR